MAALALDVLVGCVGHLAVARGCGGLVSALAHAMAAVAFRILVPGGHEVGPGLGVFVPAQSPCFSAWQLPQDVSLSLAVK